MKRNVILASSSPRRTEILNKLGVNHHILVADIDETPLLGEAPMDLVHRLSYSKAEAVKASVDSGALIIGSDTIVVDQGKILGKPLDRAHALQMLMDLSGRTHQVMTGVSVIDTATGLYASHVGISKVVMKAYSQEMALRYIDTLEPMDKAGAYGIQEVGGTLVDHMEGEFYTIAGFSVGAFLNCLDEIGLDFFEDLCSK